MRNEIQTLGCAQRVDFESRASTSSAIPAGGKDRTLARGIEAPPPETHSSPVGLDRPFPPRFTHKDTHNRPIPGAAGSRSRLPLFAGCTVRF